MELFTINICSKFQGHVRFGILLALISRSCFPFFIDFECPEKNGFFHDHEQCDLYYECIDNKRKSLFQIYINLKIIILFIATAKLCPDGLLFDNNNPNQEKCDYPFNVDCGGREYVRE